MPLRHRALFVAVALSLVAGPAYAGHKKPPVSSTPATYDVSYPQCGAALPTNITGGIVGVNDGIVLSGNPCLATEYAWAAKGSSYAPAFYANTGNPGPAYSSHWPKGQLTPQPCDGTNTSACAYDYGWNYGLDAFARAVAVTPTAAGAMWWLDVETGNSWETLESAYGQNATAQANDQASLAGAVAALQSKAVPIVGVYSTSYQWSQIMGVSSVQFAAQPAWVAGVSSLATAQANCASTSFTGGRVTLTQYASSGYDADYHC